MEVLPSYVYRWGSTHADHCSARCRRADDATWYTKTPITEPGRIEGLVAQMDSETAIIYQQIARSPIIDATVAALGQCNNSVDRTAPTPWQLPAQSV
jgi:hypothetical protein